MKRNVFGYLRYLDENDANKLSRHMGTDEETRNRVFAVTEEKVKNMKKKDQSKAFADLDNMEKKADIIDVTKRPFWTVPMRAAAACAAVAVVGVGIFGIMRVIDLPMYGADSDNTVAAGAESDTDFVFTGDYSTPDNGVSESKPAFDVSTAKPTDTEKQASSAAVSSAEKKDTSSAVVSSEREDVQSEYTSSEDHGSSGFEETSSSDTGKSGYTWENSDINSDPVGEIDVMQGITDSKKVLKITKNMTYEDVTDLLGVPNDLLTGNYAQYIVDGEYLLMLKWDYSTDPVLKSGKELLESCPKISQMKNDSENRTFDCFVVDYNGASIRVTCPQYSLFDCAVINVHAGEQAEQWKKTVDRAITDGSALRIKHDGNILEKYPPLVTPESIESVP